MSERWGFDLSMSAVRLMRRQGENWAEVAVEKIEGADIESRLQGLADRVAPETSVDVFLPRDQILYDDVKLNSAESAREDIHIAMEGRTPYALDELAIDWELIDSETARVAAIAKETLDEARDFAAGRGLDVKGYSALSDQTDFPRLPDFGGYDDAPVIADEVIGAAFKSRRTSQPEADADDPFATSAEPVIKVDEATPVMSVTPTSLPPLNPGAPLPRQNSAPRVRTDIGASAASRRVASVTSDAPISVRRRERALPTPILAACAALLSIGIAAIIWAILPTQPETSQSELVEAPTVTEVQDEPTTVEPSPEPDITEFLSDEPPVVWFEIAEPSSPEVVFVPVNVATAIDATTTKTPSDALVAYSADGAIELPKIAEALDRRPENLLGLDLNAPDTLASVALADADMPARAAMFSAPRASRNVTSGLFDLEAFASNDRVIAALAPPAAPIVEEPVVEPVEEPIVVDAGEDTSIEEPQSGQDQSETELALLTPTEPIEVEPATEPVEEPAAAAVEPESAPQTEDEQEALQLVPTELAQSLTDIAPRSRPGDFGERIERQRYGGRTISELADLRPAARPGSDQMAAMVDRATTAPSELAVATSLAPRGKPDNFDAMVASVRVAQQAARQTAAAAASAPDTTAAIEAAMAEEEADDEATSARNSPRMAIPSTASVARQATLENAIRLNRVNLVGVYGSAADRRALVRLPSGRYVKVKVGDRIDGGTVAQISASELLYVKRGRTVSLKVPQG